MEFYYILDKDGNPVEEPDRDSWCIWFENFNNPVAQEQIGDVRISTVFMGIDHNYGVGLPALWETMIIGGELDGEQEQFSGNRDDAILQHLRITNKVLKLLAAKKRIHGNGKQSQAG